MKKVVYKKYGSPDVLKIANVPKPRITGKRQALVKVVYSSLNAIDWKNRKGDFRLVTGWFKPRTGQGFDVTGVIEALSDDMRNYEIGDTVVGQMHNYMGGTLSEYVVLAETQFIKVSSDTDKVQLAGLPMAGTTAWMALFRNAKLQKGQKVLINGGSSGVGHLAIQIAKAYGAEVTSVSSGKNEAFCKSIGADDTVDYQKQDFTTLNKKFDIVFDVVFNSSFGKVKQVLSPNGMYIGTTPSLRLITDMICSKRAKFVAVHPCKEALTDLYRLMNEGLLHVHTDKIFSMNEIVEAHAFMQQSRTVGKVIIKIE